MKKKVLLTLNPRVIESRCFSTMRRLVRLLDECSELRLLPVTGYDFKRGRVTAYERNANGSFKPLGMIRPHADLWIIYSDGFYLDHRAFGFKLRRDYLNAQLAFHQQQLSAGNIQTIINSPEAEARTLKNWLAALDVQASRIIPTYLFSDIAEVHDFQRRQGAIVAKLNWGGANTGIERLRSEADVREFHQRLARYADRDLSDYCFQTYHRGDEKRFWFIGGHCVGASIFHGVETPWSGVAADFRVRTYDHHVSPKFTRELAAASRLCALSGITIGAIDFIGSRINEVNGSGTVLTVYDHNRMIIDHRPAFLDYVRKVLKAL